MYTTALLILFQSGRALTELVNLSSNYCILLMGPRWGKIPTSNKALKYQRELKWQQVTQRWVKTKRQQRKGKNINKIVKYQQVCGLLLSMRNDRF